MRISLLLAIQTPQFLKHSHHIQQASGCLSRKHPGRSFQGDNPQEGYSIRKSELRAKNNSIRIF